MKIGAVAVNKVNNISEMVHIELNKTLTLSSDGNDGNGLSLHEFD